MKHDEIHYWSEVKLDIIKEYAQAYSTILHAQKNPSLYHVYIDGFAGTGKHKSKRTGEFVQGSPTNALNIEPAFREYHLIDLNEEKVASLQEMTKNSPNVKVYHGDCNKILLNEVFPLVPWNQYKRALCILDPYGMHLSWDVLKKAGEMESIDIFFNFSIMDANMNMFRQDLAKVDPDQVKRMNICWGDDSWKQLVYNNLGNLFGWDEKVADNEAVVKALQKRIKQVAGFKYVPDPIPMRNKKGATVYYLFFASQKPVAKNIVQSIFDKYKDKGIN